MGRSALWAAQWGMRPHCTIEKRKSSNCKRAKGKRNFLLIHLCSKKMTPSKKGSISALGHFTLGRTEAGEFHCTLTCLSKWVGGLWGNWPPSVISCILKEKSMMGGLSPHSSLETKPKYSIAAFFYPVFMSRRVQDLLALDWFSNITYANFSFSNKTPSSSNSLYKTTMHGTEKYSEFYKHVFIF